MKAKATMTMMPEASPSMPSVRLTALDMPTMKKVAMATKGTAPRTMR